MVDGKGNFSFKNLPPKTFYLLAMKDESGTSSLLQDSKNLFAFADKPVTPQLEPAAITLYAYATKQQDKASTTSANPGNRNKPDGNLMRIKDYVFKIIS